jgi:hypothetical protein
MNGLTAVMLVVLGASGPLHTPDLQVEAVTAAGVELPELADAVARALVVGGGRVVLRAPGSGPCEHCTRIEVTETGPGIYRVEVSHRDHAASTALRLPAGSLLFDRARAIAIQARMLVTWKADPEAKPVVARRLGKTETKAAVEEPPEARLSVAGVAPDPASTRTREAAPGVESASPLPPTPGVEQPVVPPTQAAPSTNRGRDLLAGGASETSPVDRMAARPADRPAAEPTRRSEALASPARPEAKAGPALDLSAARTAASRPRWPWIPTAVGAGAAVAAGICAAVARDRYNGLSDKGQSYDSARALKSQGENWQLASFVLAGVAVAGLGTGIVGFSTRSSGSPSVAALVSPVRGGGMVALAGDLP